MQEKNDNGKNDGNTDAEKREFKGYALKRIGVGILLTFAVLWIFGTLLGFFDTAETVPVATTHDGDRTTGTAGHDQTTVHGTAATHSAEPADHGTAAPMHPAAPETAHQTGHSDTPAHAAKPKSDPKAPPGSAEPGPEAHGTVSATAAQQTAAGHDTERAAPAEHTAQPAAAAEHTAQPAAAGDHAAPAAGGHDAAPVYHGPQGVAFINATIQPMAYELNERFWGWRPNDILDFTDNVNNFQLGVLEVTRRTAVALAERISRTGSTAAFDKNLETAMNWFMIKADRYWFPSPESKYQAGLEELEIYREKLVRGEAKFYTRTDNLIPLLMAYEDLLGSCDDNLVKVKEDDGSTVSHFKADDYFYYAKGVASAMYTVLSAVHHDFAKVIESRRGEEVLHHAILSCHHAMEINPIYITNSSLSGILSNHRANMAAPISHARFYIGVLIKTLST